MRRLHHIPLSPFGRAVRLVAAEMGLELALVEAPLEPQAAFAAAEAGGFGRVLETTAPKVMGFDASFGPIMIEGERAIGGTRAVLEHLEAAAAERSLLPKDPHGRAEVRRLMDWAETALWREAVEPALIERLLKRLFGAGAPETQRLRAASAAAKTHLSRLSALLETRPWLAGEALSLADFVAAAQLSTLDYLGNAPWGLGGAGDENAAAREWYALMKSRPAFRGVLADRAPGLGPSVHYADPDF